ncbi:MAG: arginine--tRNA ligase [Candidatus Spechtbacterales bacterium]
MLRNTVKARIKKSIQKAQETGALPVTRVGQFRVERPSRADQGDWATSVAMVLASATDKKPKTVAKILRDILVRDEIIASSFARVEVAPPGFINFYINNEKLIRGASGTVRKGKPATTNVGKGVKLNLEFLSVNPTGELHVGHARTAFYGDVLARVLCVSGFALTREYYINNARQSAQIKELGKTALGKGTSYKGPYLDQKIKEHKSKLTRLTNPSAAGYLIASAIQKDIRTFLASKAHIEFDVWKEEEELYEDREIEETFQELKKKGYTYEKDGAVWLASTRVGDIQDQVLVRSSGENTYFMADIAYHRDKARRGFTKLIDIWGADHQGHVRRMKAAMGIFGIKDMEVLIAQLVRLKGGERLSKRKGNIISISDLLDVVGEDAARYFFLTKSLDSQMEFDMELASAKNQKNPVYYIQYTHARISSIRKKAGVKIKPATLATLKEDGEVALMRVLAQYQDVVEDAARDYQVHRLTAYALELATAFNQFYRDLRVIDEGVVHEGRLALIDATGVTLRSALELLGISAPEEM